MSHRQLDESPPPVFAATHKFSNSFPVHPGVMETVEPCYRLRDTRHISSRVLLEYKAVLNAI